MAKKRTSAPAPKKEQGVVAAKLAASFDKLAQEIQDADCREGRDSQKAAALAKLNEAKSYLGEFAVDSE